MVAARRAARHRANIYISHEATASAASTCVAFAVRRETPPQKTHGQLRARATTSVLRPMWIAYDPRASRWTLSQHVNPWKHSYPLSLKITFPHSNSFPNRATSSHIRCLRSNLSHELSLHCSLPSIWPISNLTSRSRVTSISATSRSSATVANMARGAT